MKIYSYTLVFLCIAFVSCQHEPPFDKKTNTPISSTNCSPDTVYFVNDVLPIISSNCAFSGCHGNGSSQDGVDLSNYEKIITTGKVKKFKPSDSDLFEVITETKSDKIMPPPPYNPLSNDQIQMIKKWIEQGAINNVCIDCDTSNVTFAQAISPIIQSNCLGCHSATSPSGGIKLSNYNEVKIQADNGALFGSVSHSVGYSSMPQGGKLTDCQIAQIRKWIDAGAKND